VLLPVPVQPYYILSAGWARTLEYVTRLAVEVGFYEGDLPGMIRHICEISEKLNCTMLTLDEIGVENAELYEAYFGGLRVSAEFGGLTGFDQAYEPASGQISIPHMWPVRLGERSLQIEIDGVLLPYAIE
jgi:hypothetical protein